MVRSSNVATGNASNAPHKQTQTALLYNQISTVINSKYFFVNLISSHSDLNLKILRDDSACPGACQVIKWVKGCFDALDKKYVSHDEFNGKQ